MSPRQRELIWQVDTTLLIVIAGRGCASRVIGPLLAAPPRAGELRAALLALSSRTWQHPSTRLPVSFGLSTIERWLYAARRASVDPVAAL